MFGADVTFPVSENGLGDPRLKVHRHSAHVVVLTLDRPEASNAINAQLARALADAVVSLNSDADVRVVILTGAGTKAFCAGADLKELAAGGSSSALHTTTGGFAGLTIADRRAVWIAAVNGAAMGGGFELALACDLVVASKTAYFGLPEVKRGMAAAAGGVYRISRTLPRAVALKIVATGEPLSAEAAERFGLANSVHEPTELLAASIALAERISSNAPLAVQGSMRLARRASDVDEDFLRSMQADLAARLRSTLDAAESPRAFASKRQPVWVGR